jgi:hypothetical protein
MPLAIIAAFVTLDEYQVGTISTRLVRWQPPQI